jgi:hypothetical protein
MKKLIYSVCILMSASLWANNVDITCKTSRGRVLHISDQGIKITESHEVGIGRQTASIQNVKTRKSGTAITSVMKYNNHKCTVHIDNQNEFSPTEDYLLVKNNDGHEMIYPLHCQKN